MQSSQLRSSTQTAIADRDARPAPVMQNRFVPTVSRWLAVGGAALVLTGCLITSPYHGQKFESRNASIPFSVQLPAAGTNAVELQCGKASAHGGLLSGESYTTFATLTRSNTPTYAPDGTAAYVASGQHSIPQDCWRYYNYPDQYDYITAVRVKVGSQTTFNVFDKAGLACLGEAVGTAASFSAWSGCEKRYSNTNGQIHNLFLKARP